MGKQYPSPRDLYDVVSHPEDGLGEGLRQEDIKDIQGAGIDWIRTPGKIAYEIDGDIWTINGDGTENVQLTSGSNRDERANYAPDTTGRIVYNSEPTAQLFLMRADGTGAVQITTAGAFAEEPCWRPDGDLILCTYQTTAGVGNFEKLYTLLPDGSSPTMLAEGVTHNYSDARYSPDGSQIVFCKDGGDKPNSEIWTMEADASNPVQLSDGTKDDEHPNWSPDGSKIAFTRDDGADTDIWIMDSDGANLTRLLTSAGADFSEQPCFSPDGERIVFVRKVGSDFALWSCDLDGSDLFQITPSSASEMAKPHWSAHQSDPLVALLASPAFTGNPTAPTPTPGDADTSIATTAFVGAAITALSALAVLDGDTAGGDLSGTYPSPLVHKISGGDIVAGSAFIANRLLIADAEPAFQVNGDGKHLWGPGGATVADTNLYRGAAAVLTTDQSLASGFIVSFAYNQGQTGVLLSPAGLLTIWRTLSSSSIFRAGTKTDTGIRFDIDASGQMRWGDGAASDLWLTHPESNMLMLQRQGSIAPLRFKLNSGATGPSALSRTMAGYEVDNAGSLDATNRYTPALKFMSSDAQFTTETPKFLAAVLGRATEAYSADTSGGMALDFAVTANAPGTTNIPVVAMSLFAAGLCIGVDALSTTPGAVLRAHGTPVAITGLTGGVHTRLSDATAFAQDVGSAITLGGNVDATPTITQFGAVKGGKENATSADYKGYLAFYTRPSSSTITERGRFDSSGNFLIQTVGMGLRVKEGSNAKQGTATLVAGVAVVSNTSVTANSRILVTSNADGGTPGSVRVSARTAGTSFTITSASVTDTSTVAWLILEPA